MARISAYEDAHDNLVWVVERNNGYGRKEFRSHEEAELYKNYLQSLENQEMTISQNQQIIENQQTIIEQGKSQRLTPLQPQRTIQVLDPEYKEWLKYKKDTDPEYKKWKAEEDRKKAEEDKKREKQRLETERERKIEKCISDISRIERIIQNYTERLKIYDKWRTIIQKLLAAGEAPVRHQHLNFHYVELFVKGNGALSLDYIKRTFETMKKAKENEDYNAFIVYHDSCFESINRFKNYYSYIQDYTRYVYLYLRVLKDRLLSSKDWRKYGFFGIDGTFRREKKSIGKSIIGYMIY